MRIFANAFETIFAIAFERIFAIAFVMVSGFVVVRIIEIAFETMKMQVWMLMKT